MYPKPARLLRQTVKPGDTFTASVTVSGHRFTLVLQDVRERWTRTEVKKSATALGASAEVIAEAPADSNGVLPLTDFGTVQFTGAVANGEALGDAGGQEIVMSAGGVTKALPSVLTSGEDFYDTWQHA